MYKMPERHLYSTIYIYPGVCPCPRIWNNYQILYNFKAARGGAD